MAALATKPNTISTNPPTDALHELVVLQRGHLEEGHGTIQPQDAHLPAAAVPDHAGLDVHVCWWIVRDLLGPLSQNMREL